VADVRKQLGAFAVLALVLLRLAIGWHFYRQGTEKLAYDADEGRYRVEFSAAPFLAQAKGPLAGWFHSQVSNDHDWSTLLAVPRQNEPLAAEEATRRARWFAEQQRARRDAEQNEQPVAIEFPPFAPYHNWASQIAEDWSHQVASVKALPGLTDKQRSQADHAFRTRKQQLAEYFAGEVDAITEYQHELWRLENWQAEPEANGLPFQEQRIASKAADTSRSPFRWISQIREFEQQFHEDLHRVLSGEQRADATTMAAIDEAMADPREQRLDQINLGVTILTISVGVCLLVGFFTRLASLTGALFLLAVIASQPPWVPGAASTIEQTVELAGMLVLAGTGAGRWFGLDFFTFALFQKCCRRS